MRKLMLLVAVFGLTGSLWAADLIIGTWKLNIAKSKFPATEKVPKELTEVYRELEASQIEFVQTSIQTDGSITSFKATWPREGGVLTAPEDLLPKGRTYVETLIAPGEWYFIVLNDGKQVRLIHKIVSKDGKTMRYTDKGTDDKDRPIEGLLLFDRQ